MSQNKQAEESLLGSLMLNPAQLDEVKPILSPDDFTYPDHRSIYQAILELDAQGVDIDVVTVADKSGNVALPGYLIYHATAGGAKSYAVIIRDKAKLRRLQEAWQKAGQIIVDDKIDLHDRVERATELMGSVFNGEQLENKTLHGRELFTVWYEELQRIANAGQKITGIHTGWPMLDANTKGWHGGEMIVVAARPGMGKTNFAINTAWAAVKQNKSILYFSLEMSKTDLMHRLAAQAEGADYEMIQTAQLGEGAVGHAVTRFAEYGIETRMHINDRAGHTMQSIRAESKRVKRRHGLDMVVIDHIGLVSSNNDNQYSKMTEISRQVKLIAKELDIPVIALAQLNRSVEQRPDPRPKMSDLRDSGAIEQDADAVIFPYRETDPDAPEDTRNIGQFIIAKLRHGKTGIIPVIVQFQYCRFVPASIEYLKQGWDQPWKAAKQGRPEPGGK